MKHKATIFRVSAIACAFLVVVGIRARHQWMEREDALQSALHAALNTSVAHSTWQISDGIQLAFTNPVQSVTWSMSGHVSTETLTTPSKLVWLAAQLPQGQKVSMDILKIETQYGQHVSEHWTLSHVMPGSLQAITNPGPWQLNVPRRGPYSIAFNAPIENPTAISRDVTFVPDIRGKWVWQNPETAEFIPKVRLLPTAQEVMNLSGGLSGIRSVHGQYLTSPISRSFITRSNEKIIIREKLPERLTLWRNGKVILRALCNTAMPGAYTPTGTFYIRSKFPHVVMKGVNPNGTHYDDPHVPWVMGLIGNIAIHGYPRASYGFPQSNGCIELPIATAKRLYGLVQVGTPVTIDGIAKGRSTHGTNSKHFAASQSAKGTVKP